MDPYQVLGVRPDADTGQIRAAYRRRARHVHPDAGGDDDAFARLQDAYAQALGQRADRPSGPPPPSGRRSAGSSRGAGPGRRPGPPPPSRPHAGRPSADRARPGWADVAQLWARHGAAVAVGLATQVALVSIIALAGPDRPAPAVFLALMAGLVAGAIAHLTLR